jgi:hypothetical protein
MYFPRFLSGLKLQLETPKRPITVGCVTFTLFHDAINVDCIEMRTAQKAYHRGFRELECISKGFHRA